MIFRTLACLAIVISAAYAAPPTPPKEKEVQVPPDFPVLDYGLVKSGDVLTLTVTSPKGIKSANTTGGAWRGGLVGDRGIFTEVIEESFAGVHRGRFWGEYRTDPGAVAGDPPVWAGGAVASVLEVLDAGKKIARGDTVWISEAPEMPKLSAQLNPGPPGNADWSMVVKYDNPTKVRPRSDSTTFPIGNPVVRNLPANQVWDIAAEYQGVFCGGASTVYVINGGNKDNFPFKIRGKNPAPDVVKAFIIAQNSFWYAAAIAHHESKFKQFTDAGLPLVGAPAGYGVFQLDNPACTVMQVWNWQENVVEGCARLIPLRQEATDWITRQVGQQIVEDPGKPLAGEIFTFGALNFQEGTIKTAIDACAIQRFNGAEKWVIYWRNPTPATSGEWLINPGYRAYVDEVSASHVAIGGL